MSHRNRRKENEEKSFDHGVVILSTGAHEYKPDEYYYNRHGDVMTQVELERMLNNSDLGQQKKLVVMIQCIGSRNEEHPYCSRICCAEAIKNAIRIKESNPESEVVILFRDIRTYGFKEKYYRKARLMGVIFMQFNEKEPPKLTINNEKVRITVKRNDGEEISFDPNILALSTGMVMSHDNEDMAKMLKVPFLQMEICIAYKYPPGVQK